MNKTYISKFITIYLHVKEEYSLASIVNTVRNIKRFYLVDFSEELRRIIVRIPIEDYSMFLTLIEKQASSIVMELKSIIKGRICKTIFNYIPHMLREKKSEYEIRALSKTDKNMIIVISCASKKDTLYLEVKRKKCLAKLCKKPLIPIHSIADFPPSLCLFDAKEENFPILLKSFNICLNSFVRLSEDLALKK